MTIEEKIYYYKNNLDCFEEVIDKYKGAINNINLHDEYPFFIIRDDNLIYLAQPSPPPPPLD